MKEIINRQYIKLTICLSIAIVCALTTISSCKNEWLDAKPNLALVVPKSPGDYQALLNNTSLLNINAPGLGVIADDNFFISPTTFRAITNQERSAYLWADTEGFFAGNAASDWFNGYNKILQTNVVLDGIQSLKLTDREYQQYNIVKGSALFFRGLNHFALAQVFCPAYDEGTLDQPGLPLHRSSNVNLMVDRSSVSETYQGILSDVLQCLPLLPETVQFATAPSKPAAYALLSRIYLSMENYDQAYLYADSCLKLKSNLLDYSKLPVNLANPFARFNEEVIFHENISNYGVFRTTNLIISPTLYSLYTANDLRKSLFFVTVGNNISFRGSYDGTLLFFGGLATDEMYLNRAECLARRGNLNEGYRDLNALLRSRWQKNANGTSTYIDRSGNNQATLLTTVLEERRKELCFRGIRWTDLRRLNRDDRFKTTITREIDGLTYTLSPGSLRYTFPLDDKEINQGGLQQNPR